MSLGIEQERRDHVEAAKAFKAAGDLASGASSPEGAANRLWREQGRHRDAAARMRGEQ